MPTPSTYLTQLTIPLVHLNGTSGQALLDENRVAASAVRAAIEALVAGAPHARDYYVIGPDAYAKARDEYLTRLSALHAIVVELDAIGLAIADQLNARHP